MTLDLKTALDSRLDDTARSWLAGALSDIEKDPASIRKTFPAAGRNVGRVPIEDRALDPAPWTTDDAARSLMLVALGDRAGEEIWDLYRFGDADEQRAIIRSLHLLPAFGGEIDLVRDAARTNDPRLVRVTLGPFGLEHLDDDDIAQIALKCVFCEVPLSCIAGLPSRATPQLARMLAGFAHERIAAGRSVAPDIWPFVEQFPPEDLLRAIEEELGSDVPERKAAAAAALADRRSLSPA